MTTMHRRKLDLTTSLLVLVVYTLPALTMAEDQVEIVSISPDSPAVLKGDERLSVTLDYNLESAESARIWVRPYTDGSRTPGYGAHPSPSYEKGKGKAEGWFTFRGGAEVDEIRVEMKANDGSLLAQIKRPVELIWGSPSSSEMGEPRTDIASDHELPVNHRVERLERRVSALERQVRSLLMQAPSRPEPKKPAPAPASCTITNISFTPNSPAELAFGQRIQITYEYDVAGPGGIRVQSLPFTGGNMNRAYGCNPSPVYRGKGTGTAFFTIRNTGSDGHHKVEIDEFRLIAKTEDWKSTVSEIPVSVHFVFSATTNPPGEQEN